MTTTIALIVLFSLGLAEAVYLYYIRPRRRKAAQEMARATAESERLREEERIARYLDGVERFPARFRQISESCEKLLNDRQKSSSILRARSHFVDARNHFEHGRKTDAIISLRFANSALKDAEDLIRCEENRIESEGLLKD